MTLVGEIMFGILVYLNLAALWSLGPPWTYRQREVAWYLSLTAWATLLFDGAFLAAVVGIVGGRTAQVLFIICLALRIGVAAWLVRMIRKSKEKTAGSDSEDP